MESIGIFFGSDTGNTENVANNIQKQFGEKNAAIYDIAQSKKKDLESHNILLLGVPTWYYGEVQCDWNDFLPKLKEIDFTDKVIALFGCGDQEDYAEYFCDALGIIYNIVKSCNATVIGHWPTKSYSFEASKGLINNTHFVGLAIDEDRQPEFTSKRIEKWVNQIRKEICFIKGC